MREANLSIQPPRKKSKVEKNCRRAKTIFNGRDSHLERPCKKSPPFFPQFNISVYCLQKGQILLSRAGVGWQAIVDLCLSNDGPMGKARVPIKDDGFLKKHCNFFGFGMDVMIKNQSALEFLGLWGILEIRLKQWFYSWKIRFRKKGCVTLL